MQVFAWVRQRDFALLGRMLEMMMASGRTDKIPAIGLKLPDDITRVPAHEMLSN
jgi:hypothetical protein